MATIMDKQWERIQKKTFTKWVNSHLMKRGQKIEEIQEEFKDGLKLMSFLEIISGKTFSKYERKPRMRIQMIQNVSTALQLIAECGVKLISISAEGKFQVISVLIGLDIVDGNLKLILGMIWTIIQKFQIEDISEEELSAKEALLLWCKKKTEGYRDVKVENFHTSWQDGMAFCAIIHKHRPDLIPYDSLKKGNPRENLQLAFDVAERELGIPKLLDLEDIVDIAKPDERSIMTYVVQYYHYFSANRKQEVAGRRIGKLVDLTNSNEQMQNDYTERAQKLAAWITEKTNQLKDNNFPNDLAALKNLAAEFKNYKDNEKPGKAAEKLSLEALFNNIALKLRSNNRGPFVPPEGTSPKDLQNLWEALLAAEREREDALRKELERQEKLDNLNKRFSNKADKLEAWIAAKDKYLKTEEQVDSLNSAKEKLKLHDAFYHEYDRSKPRVDELQEILKEIQALNDPQFAALQERVNKITENWTNLKGAADTKKQDLLKKLEIQQKMEDLRFEFAKLAKEYNRWAASTIESVNERDFGDSLEAVQAYKQELDKNDAEVTKNSEDKKAVIQGVWDQMQALGVTDLKYTVLTMKDIESRHGQILEAIKRRQEAYEEELNRQLLLEEKRKEFAKMAQEFLDHLANRKSEIGKLQGEPEPLIESIKSTYADGAPEKERLAALSQFNNEMSEMGISENKHTEYTPAILTNRSERFGSWVKAYIGALGEEKERKALYAFKAKELMDWIEQEIPQLQDRSFDNTLSGAQQKAAEFSQYKTGKKAEAYAKKPEIERLFSEISKLLKKNDRPEFTPPAGLTLEDIDKAWKNLEEEEKKKEEDLRKELERQEKLSLLVRRFNSDASDLESWITEKQKYLETRETIETLFQAQFGVKLFEAYETEYEGRVSRFKQLEELKNEIISLNYHDANTITQKSDQISASMDALKQAAQQKDAYLQEQLKLQQDKDNLRYEFARLAKDFNNWVKETVEKIDDYNFGYTLQAVAAYSEELDKDDAQVNAAADERKNAIDQVYQSMQQQNVPEYNKHSQYSIEEVNAMRQQITDELAKRRTAYSEELARQNNHDSQRQEFAKLAKNFLNYLAEQKAQLEKVDGDVDAKISAIQAIHQDGAGGKAELDKVAAFGEQLSKQGIYGNPHTNLTVPGLVSRNNLHNTFVKGLIAGLTEEKEMQERIKAQEAELAEQEKRENMIIEFSNKATALNQWMENAEESASEDINANYVEDVERLVAEFDVVLKERDEKQSDYDNLAALAQKMTEAKITDFSGITMDDITQKWNALKELLDQRKSALAQELEKQKANDEICKEFAKKAQDFSEWLRQQQDALAATKGALEEQLQSVKNQQTKYTTEGKPNLEDLEASNKKVEEAGVKHNKHTDLSLRTLQSEFEQLGNAMDKQEQLLTNEIMAKKNADVTPDQLKEFKEVFDHFDRDKNGLLTRVEFKACLQTLGDEPSDSELENMMKKVDPEGKGITFDKFTEHMIQRTKDTDSSDEILDSFKSLANDKEFITEEDLRRVLSNERVDYLIKRMPLYNNTPGSYDYKAWVATAYGGK